LYPSLSLLLGWLFAEVLSLAVAKIAENSRQSRQYIEALKRRAALIPGFKKRRERLLQVVEVQNDRAANLGNRRGSLSKRLRKINATTDYFVREVGCSVEGAKCYTFAVSNRYVNDYVAKGQKHTLLDESWKSGQIVDVWSKSLVEARVVVAEKYSASLGYVVENIKSTKDTPS